MLKFGIFIKIKQSIIAKSFLYSFLSFLFTCFLHVKSLSSYFSRIFIGFFKKKFDCGFAPTHQPSNITISGLSFMLNQSFFFKRSSVDLSNFGNLNFLNFFFFYKLKKFFNQIYIMCARNSSCFKQRMY